MSEKKATISQVEILKLACERQREIVAEYGKHHSELAERFGEKSQEAEWAMAYWKKENQKQGEIQQMLQQEYSKEIPSAWGIR
jgi:hypothetical protein